ncbi:MAG: aldo/keto reductase [Eubacteriales bacterium]|nr:aldo/keto reductase [Eubacteriales bacterium]
MYQRPFGKLGFDVSGFGVGAMRLPTLPEGGIDRPEAIKMIRYAIDHGVTYVDTAYPYHGGESETVVGLALQDGYRERVKLATKSPTWLIEKPEDYDRLLDEQLEKLGVDYVDFYLLHALDKEKFENVVLKYDAFAFLDRAKAAGKIKHAAFSFHDDMDTFKRIIDAYPFEMAQIQMNYLDEFNQARVEGMKYAASKGVPIVIMEPLRGGRLAGSLPTEVTELFEQAAPGRSAAEWAFRWMYDFPEVTTILSGVSTMEQLQDNLRIFENAAPGTMTAAEKDAVTKARLAFEKRIKVGCTGCEYCMPCPQGVAIPRIFARWNDASTFDDWKKGKAEYANIVEKNEDASHCVQCGACESVCPQDFSIIDLLQAADAELR